MRNHRFVPCVDDLPARIAPSTFGCPVDTSTPTTTTTTPTQTTVTPTSTDIAPAPAPISSTA